MKVGILGSGSVGGRLAALARAAGHDVCMGTRSDADLTARHAEIFIIAIPYLACSEAMPQIREALAGKVVVDATNPLNSDWSPISFGGQSSAAEEIAKLIPEARVVKAFNTVFADIMVPEKMLRDGQRVTSFVCADDQAAKALVLELADSIGFSALDSGPLSNSQYTEAMAHLNIQLAVALGGGTDAAFIYHRP